MKGARYKKHGWFGESHRHYLAAKGIKTKRYYYRDVDNEIAMNRFDVERLKRLSSGSDRVVFALDDDANVLKVAKNPRGLQQNQQEKDWFVGVEPKYVGKDFAVMKRAQPASLETKRMLKDLAQFSQTDFDRKTYDLQIALEKYDLQDYANYDLAWRDFLRPSSWGEVDGEPVLVDKGSLSLAAITSRESWADKEWDEIKQERRELKKTGKLPLFSEKRQQLIDESDFQKGVRERREHNTLITIDAAKFKKAFEEAQGEKLAWNSMREDNLRDVEVYDAYPELSNRHFDVNDGRHRLDRAAREGKLIQVSVGDEFDYDAFNKKGIIVKGNNNERI